MTPVVAGDRAAYDRQLAERLADLLVAAVRRSEAQQQVEAVVQVHETPRQASPAAIEVGQ